MDPILVLRKQFSSGSKSELDGDCIKFEDGTKLMKSTKTRLERRAASGEDVYTVYDLWFCVTNRHIPAASYGLAASRQQVNVLGAALRNRVCDYLTGQTNENVIKHILKPIVQTHLDNTIESSNLSSSDLAPKQISDDDLIYIFSNGRNLSDRTTILINPIRDFKNLQNFAKTLFSEETKLQTSHNRYQSQEDDKFYKSRYSDMDIGGIDTHGSFSEPAPAKVKKSKGTGFLQTIEPKSVPTEIPIIVVPGIVTSIINRYNMIDFFENSKFVEINPRTSILDAQASNRAQIKRKKDNGEIVTYEVADRLSPKDWRRVVAVLVTGQVWQLSQYPYGKDVAEFFKKYCGFFVRFEGQTIPKDTIANWNVNILTLSKYERHDDATALLSFWNKLDHFACEAKWDHLKI